MRLEGRARLIVVRHRVRALRHHSHRRLAFCDNLGLTLALGKGRAAAPHSNKCCRELLGSSIVADVSVVIRWLPSEWNPADAPSRLQGPLASGVGTSRRYAAFARLLAEGCEAEQSYGRALLREAADLEWRQPTTSAAGLVNALEEDPALGNRAADPLEEADAHLEDSSSESERDFFPGGDGDGAAAGHQGEPGDEPCSPSSGTTPADPL